MRAQSSAKHDVCHLFLAISREHDGINPESFKALYSAISYVSRSRISWVMTLSTELVPISTHYLVTSLRPCRFSTRISSLGTSPDNSTQAQHPVDYAVASRMRALGRLDEHKAKQRAQTFFELHSGFRLIRCITIMPKEAVSQPCITQHVER